MVTDHADPWAALGDPTRRGILVALAERPRSVTELASGLPISRPAVSQHLRVLEQARLVVVQPRGRRRVYQASPEGLQALRAQLDEFWAKAMATFHLVAEEGKDSER